jgi:hypothetical protein
MTGQTFISLEEVGDVRAEGMTTSKKVLDLGSGSLCRSTSRALSATIKELENTEFQKEVNIGHATTDSDGLTLCQECENSYPYDCKNR